MKSFGINLAESATKAMTHGLGTAWPYFILVLAVAGTSFYQQRQIAGRNPQAQQANPQQAMLMKIMPLFFAVISLTLPAGIVVYFLVSNLFRIGQQALITKTMYADGDGAINASARETDTSSTAGGGGSFLERLKEARPDPARAKREIAESKAKRDAASKGTSGTAKGKGAPSATTTTKAKGTGSAPSRSAPAPSRTAPSAANRSNKKKKRK